MKQRRTLKSTDKRKENNEVPDKPTSTELEVIETTARSVVEWTPGFVTTVDQALQVVRQKREFLNKVMVEGTHYGKIPGAGDKPVLLLPGAQTLSANMALHPVFGDAAPAIEDWTGDEHMVMNDSVEAPELEPEPFIAYRRFCELRRQTGPAPEDYMIVARAEGSCNSWESKYRYRNAARKCPQCGKTGFLFKSKPPRKGFFCWSKPEAGKNGCGANFKEDDARILDQVVGRMKNPDVLDQANTILKMADKRAYIAATLQATGCADLFTQDLEDMQGEEIPEGEVPESTTSTTTAPTSAPVSSAAATPPTSPPKTPPAPTTAAATAPAATPPPASPGTTPAAPAPSASAASASAASTTVPATTSAQPPTATSVAPPTSGAAINLEPAEIGQPEQNGIGPLRTKALEVAVEAQRIHAEAKYPGQTFTAHQLEAVARRSIDKWLVREQRKATTFAEATEQDLNDVIEAIEKTLRSAA